MLLVSLLTFVVRIGILVEVDSISVFADDYHLKSGGHRFHANGMMIFKPDLIKYKGKKTRGISYPVAVSSKKDLIKVNNRPYPGRIAIKKGQLGLIVINYVDLEEYIVSVLRYEMGSLRPEFIEALKAQAVAARSYCLSHLRKHDESGFDLISGVEDQIYRGYVEDSIIKRAVRETRGKILVYNGKPIDAKYHSTCGGITAPASEVWPVGDVPYLVAVNDRGFCQKSPHYRWRRSFPLSLFYDVIKRIIKEKLNTPWKLKILRGNRSRRLSKIIVIGKNDQRPISGYRFRKAFDLKSTLFKIKVEGDSIIIDGRGWGHGVGMCQWGAIGMAEQGYNYKQILGHYYPKTRLARLR